MVLELMLGLNGVSETLLVLVLEAETVRAASVLAKVVLALVPVSGVDAELEAPLTLVPAVEMALVVKVSVEAEMKVGPVLAALVWAILL